MYKKTISLFLMLSLIACQSAKRKEQTINISGAFALYPLVVKWSEEYGKENPQIRFNITAGGAGKGLADALAGVVDLGMFSRTITPEEIAKGTWWVGLTIDAVVPTLSAENPFLAQLKKRGITQEELHSLFISKKVNDWQKLISIANEEKISVYTRSDACGAAETFASYLGGKQEDLKGVGIYGDPGLAEAVAKDPLGIGFNNTIYVYDIKTGKKRPGMEVFPLDRNGNGNIDPEEDFYEDFSSVLKAIAEGHYPSPPARELYFVSNGKPQKKVVLDFIRWTLTEGQQYVKEAGYVPLDQMIIRQYLDALEK